LSNSEASLEWDATSEAAADPAGAAGDVAQSSSTASSVGSGGGGGSSLDSDATGGSAIDGPPDVDLGDGAAEASIDAKDTPSLVDAREVGVAPDGGDGRRDPSPEASVADVSVPRDVSNPILCRQSFETPKNDPNTHLSWNPVWYCANDRGAALFEGANSRAQIGYMTTVDSWFVCFRHGEVHRGGDDVWYYTQGDGALPGWEARHAWGYMPSFYVRASPHPSAGIPECTANP